VGTPGRRQGMWRGGGAPAFGIDVRHWSI
jgi:hypothetical protein